MTNETLEAILKTIESIGPSLISLGGVWLGWKLGVHSQWRERSLERFRERITAFREIRSVIENIPPTLSSEQLFQSLEGDTEMKDSLSHRLVRLFGLRTELIPNIDQRLAQVIDNSMKPIFTIHTGEYSLKSEKLQEFAGVAVQLRALTATIEQNLVSEYDRTNK